MSKRNSSQTIEPFPQEINREHFASWLSGFTDGEGCFYLGVATKGKVRARLWAVFNVTLRADDGNALKLIQSHLQCGSINLSKRKDKSPVAQYIAFAIDDLVSKVMPHFDNYPLLAKKKRDYAIWREGVLLIHRVHLRERRYVDNKGPISKWKPSEREEFMRLVMTMKEQRKLNSETCLVNKPKPPAEEYAELLF